MQLPDTSHELGESKDGVFVALSLAPGVVEAPPAPVVRLFGVRRVVAAAHATEVVAHCEELVHRSALVCALHVLAAKDKTIRRTRHNSEIAKLTERCRDGLEDHGAEGAFWAQEKIATSVLEVRRPCDRISFHRRTTAVAPPSTLGCQGRVSPLVACEAIDASDGIMLGASEVRLSAHVSAQVLD